MAINYSHFGSLTACEFISALAREGFVLDPAGRRGSIDDSIYCYRRCWMPKTRIAKLFRNGSSQAVRLPAEFRFDGDEVFATRDEITGDVVLSTRPGARTWGEFFQLMRSIEVPADFMAERPMNVAPVDRHVFGDPED